MRQISTMCSTIIKVSGVTGAVIVLVFTSGCATYNVITSSPDQMAKEACQVKCVSLPRVYTGTIMELCALYSQGGGGLLGSIVMLDLPFSFVADTVILPYTAYKQITEGDFSTEEICRAEEEKKKAAREEKRKQLILQGR